MSSFLSRRGTYLLNVLLSGIAAALVFCGPKQTVRDLAPPAKSNPPVEEAPSFNVAAEPAEQRHWLVAQLRTLGVSNAELARVVQADLDAKWMEYAAGVTMKCKGDPDTMAALQLEIDKRTDSDMRAALGDEGFRQWDHANMLREANPGGVALSGAEIEASYTAWKNLQLRELQFKEARLSRTMDEADIEGAHTRAVAEYNEQLKGILGSERYANAQQANENVATANMRDYVAQAKPNEAQIHTLLAAQRQLDEQQAALEKRFQGDGSNPEYLKQMNSIKESRDNLYTNVLGPAAFDSIQKTQDPSYAQMKKNESLWGLDDGTIDAVYSALKYHDKVVRDYDSDSQIRASQGQAVDWDAVNSSIKSFSAQTEQSLRAYLGEEKYDRLKRNGVFRLNEVPYH